MATLPWLVVGLVPGAAFAPYGYPRLCIGFDLLVAGSLAVAISRTRATGVDSPAAS